MKQELVIAGLWRLSSESPPPPGWQTPYFYLLGIKNLILIDAGYSELKTVEKINQILADSGAKLQAVILTHGHTDHAGAVPALKEHFHPLVIAHELERTVLQRRKLELMIDQWVDGDFHLKTELGVLKFIDTPGHSPGHLCFYLEKERILFTGDLVVGEGTSFVGPPDGDMSDYMMSLKKVQALNPGLILPGHGPIVRNPEKHLQELIEHRLLREYQILKILSQGPRTAQELVQQIYVGLIHPGLYSVAEITVLGHLNKLEKEGKIVKQLVGDRNLYQLNQ